jgi:hypothetical protein
MSGTKVGAVIDALVAIFDAATTATVFDGPDPSDDSPDHYVIVGNDGDPDGDQAATGSQDWAAMATSKPRKETASVDCVIVAQTGGADLSTLRAEAMEISASLEDAIRADVTLSNGGGALVHWASYASTFTLRQGTGTNGLFASLAVTVDYIARIT